MNAVSKVDLHSHTRGSDGRGTPAQIALAARRAGLDALCLTDHHTNTTTEVAAVADALLAVGVHPILGTEYSTEQGHLLVFGLVVPPYRWGTYPEMQTVIDDVNRMGGACVVPHPFKGYKRALKEHLVKVRGLCGVEAINGQIGGPKDFQNASAAKAAKRMGVPTVGSSDAHDPDDIGRVYTEFDGHVRTTADLVTALRSGIGFRPMLNAKLPPRPRVVETVYAGTPFLYNPNADAERYPSAAWHREPWQGGPSRSTTIPPSERYYSSANGGRLTKSTDQYSFDDWWTARNKKPHR